MCWTIILTWTVSSNILEKKIFEQLNQLIEELQAEDFDLIYDAHRSIRSRWIVSRLTAFGMKRKPTVWKINKRTLNRKLLIHLGWNRLQQGLSQREQWLLPLKQHAPHGLDASTELFPDQEDTNLIETLMSEHNLLPKGFIAIGPSASQPLKCWPLVHFTHLTEMLIQSGWKIVLVGGPDEPEPELLEEEFGVQDHQLSWTIESPPNCGIASECKISRGKRYFPGSSC